MPFDFTPINYGAQLGLDQLQDPRVLSMQRDQIRLQQQRQTSEVAAGQQKQQQQEAYTAAVGEYLKNPTPQGAAALQARFPDQATAIKSAWETLGKDQQDTEFKHATTIYGLLANNRIDDAKKALQDRIAADKAAGQEFAEEEQLLAAIDKDPVKAKSFVGLTLSSIGGPEKFAAIQDALRLGGAPTLRDVAPGTVIIDPGAIDPETGKPKVVFESPFKPQLVTGPNGEVIEYTPPNAGGGDQGSGGGAQPYKNGWAPRSRNGGDNTDAQVDNYIGSVAKGLGVDPDAPIPPAMIPKLAQEMAKFESGGNPNAKSNRNNNPGNIRNGDGSFKKFPTMEAGRAAQHALLAKYLARGQTSVRSIIEGVPAGGATSGGNIRALTGPKQQDPQPYRMSPEEVATEGLDPNVVYYRNEKGVPTVVGGQGKAGGQLKPWPVQALQARSTNEAALKNIFNALWLLDPQNGKDPRVRSALKAIGPTTGMLGNTFTNWNDPAGAEFRALIGQIGGLIIKDTSGAAVSLSEDQRLAKWVPLVTDTPAAARAKLRNLDRELKQRNIAMDETYSEDQGFRPFQQPREDNAAPVRVRSKQEAMKLAPGTVYVTPTGQRMRR